MATSSLRIHYDRDGLLFPLEAMSEAQALVCRQEFEAIEARYGDTPNFRYATNGGINFIVPLLDDLTQRAEILDRVEEIIGPDILAFGVSLFNKPARSTQYISWHQDLTYWGLSGTEEVTAWVALSAATRESGCMRMVPGSHRQDLVEHRDTFHADNLLTRGQEIAVEIDEDKTVDIVLRPGQFSLHHGHTFHGSHPNRSDDRRIGISINYIAPAMAIRTGIKPMVRLVRGEDRHGHFSLAPPPRGVLDPGDIERMREAKSVAEAFYYEGTDQRLVTDAVATKRLGRKT